MLLVTNFVKLDQKLIQLALGSWLDDTLFEMISVSPNYQKVLPWLIMNLLTINV